MLHEYLFSHMQLHSMQRICILHSELYFAYNAGVPCLAPVHWATYSHVFVLPKRPPIPSICPRPAWTTKHGLFLLLAGHLCVPKGAGGSAAPHPMSPVTPSWYSTFYMFSGSSVPEEPQSVFGCLVKPLPRFWPTTNVPGHIRPSDRASVPVRPTACLFFVF